MRIGEESSRLVHTQESLLGFAGVRVPHPLPTNNKMNTIFNIAIESEREEETLSNDCAMT